MKIILTVREALDRGVWDEICKLKGFNPWCVNEGLMSSDEEITLTLEEAEKLGIK